MKAIRRTAVVLLVIAALVLPTLSVSAQGGTWNTGVNVQNLGSGDAHVRFKFYAPTGGDPVYIYPPITSDPLLIPKDGVINVYVPGLADLPTGRYSAVVESDQPVAAVANNQDIADQMGDSYLGSDPGANQLIAPLWFRNYRNNTTKFYIQNASATAQNITIALSKAGQGTAAVTKTYENVPAYSAQEVDLAGDTAFNALEGFYGAATVQGASGDIAMVVTTNKMVSGAVSNYHTEYRGIRTTQASKNLVAPLVFCNYRGWATGINVANTEAVTATIVVTYTASSGYVPNPGMVRVGSITLGPYGAASIYLPDGPMSGLPGNPLPAGFYGGAELLSNTNILAVVNDTYNSASGSYGSAYEAFSKTSATSQIAGPLVYRDYAGSETGINVQNVGNQPTTVTLVLTKAAESSPVDNNNNPVTGPWTLTQDVAAGAQVVFYLPSELAGVHKLYGAVALQSSGGVPIVALMNTTRYGAGISSNYIGINH